MFGHSRSNSSSFATILIAWRVFPRASGIDFGVQLAENDRFTQPVCKSMLKLINRFFRRPQAEKCGSKRCSSSAKRRDPPAPGHWLRHPGGARAISAFHRGAEHQPGAENRGILVERVRARVRELMQMVLTAARDAVTLPATACLLAGSGSGSGWLEPWPPIPRFSSWTSRLARSIRLHEVTCSANFSPWKSWIVAFCSFVTDDLRGGAAGLTHCPTAALVAVLSPDEFALSDNPWAAAYVRAFGDGLESGRNRGTP